MIIDTDIIERLLQSNISGDQVRARTGIAKSLYFKYKKKETDIKKMSLETAEKLQNLQMQQEKERTQFTVTIKGIKKAVGEFNSWKGAARIYFDKNELSVETYVYSSPESYQEFNDNNIIEVAQKATINMTERDDRITMLELQKKCQNELKKNLHPEN